MTSDQRTSLRLGMLRLPNGELIAVISKGIPDDEPEQIREGLARRALVARGRPCPCGARLDLNRAARRARSRGLTFAEVRVYHEDGCPAVGAELVRRYGR
jgi:hypothetical protein